MEGEGRARGCGTGDVRVFVEAVANFERGNSFGEARGELRVDAGLDVYAVRAYAGLAGAAEFAGDDPCRHRRSADGT